MHIQRSTALSVLIGVLGGCATTPEYAPAAGAPRASIVLERRGTEAMAMGLYANGQNCTARMAFPDRGAPFWEGRPLVLEAGREVAFRIAGFVTGTIPSAGLSTGTCNSTILSFRPQAGGTYKLKYTMDKGQMKCFSSIVRVGQGGQEFPEDSYRTRTEIAGAADDAPACAP